MNPQPDRGPDGAAGWSAGCHGAASGTGDRLSTAPGRARAGGGAEPSTASTASRVWSLTWIFRSCQSR